jgi:hypothetical protein
LDHQRNLRKSLCLTRLLRIVSLSKSSFLCEFSNFSFKNSSGEKQHLLKTWWNYHTKSKELKKKSWNKKIQVVEAYYAHKKFLKKLTFWGKLNNTILWKNKKAFKSSLKFWNIEFIRFPPIGQCSYSSLIRNKKKLSLFSFTGLSHYKNRLKYSIAKLTWIQNNIV